MVFSFALYTKLYRRVVSLIVTQRVCYYDFMGSHELPSQIGAGEQPVKENLDPRHFYAAYVFDDAATRQRDVAVLIHEAQQLGYPVRYWWLSEAMELQGSPDRLIVCLPNSSWPECFENEEGHFCNVVHVFEGIDDEGQLYVRRERGCWRTSQ